jgi:AraC-like DNA-binding protein
MVALSGEVSKKALLGLFIMTEPPSVVHVRNSQFYVSFSQKIPSWNYPNVFSPFWRLYYDLERGHKVVFPNTGKTVTLGPDKIVLIPDHQMFHAEGSEPRAKFWLQFTCMRRVHPGQPIPIVFKPSVCEMALMQQLIGLIKAKTGTSQKNCILHASLALLHLTLSRPAIQWLDKKPDALQEVLRHIEENFRSPLTNHDLARLAYVSERSLTRRFLYYQGVSPKHFLLQVRVRRAAEHMLNTQDSLSEIAEQTGFPNRDYLTRVFTKITGQSPALFRKAQTRAHGQRAVVSQRISQ